MADPPPIAALRVLEPGLATTLQDAGRPGWRRYGVSASGALDLDALAIANALVGAAPSAAALEMRLTGPSLVVEADSVRIAVVGAAARLRVWSAAAFGAEGAAAERGPAAGGAEDAAQVVDVGPGLWRTLRLERGDRVAVGSLSGSATAYLAVEGGFDAPAVMGSRSTFLRSRFGGFGGAMAGRALRSGDRLALQRTAAPVGPERALTEHGDFAAPAGAPILARATAGPQQERFDPASVARFYNAEWRVSARSDRMGLRLEGPPLAHVAALGGADIISDGLLMGAVQTPANGQPIILLADRQTAGGYAKIACVISADLGRLGRAGPGDRLRFEAVSPEDAVAAARAAAQRRAAAIASIDAYAPPGALDQTQLYRANLITVRAPDPDA